MTAQIIAMALFSLTMSLTPGPVNVTTFSSGMNYGFRSTMPFVSGATIGFTLLLVFIGLGIGNLATYFPIMGRVLCYAGALFIGYVGFKIMRANFSIENTSADRPLFRHGVIMQWLNIKAWISCLAGVSAFSAGREYGSLLIFCSIYFFICYASIAVWALAGDVIMKMMKNKRYISAVNTAMGAVLICLAVLILFSGGDIGRF